VTHVQDHMQAVLETLVRDDRERGLQLAAYVDGELVVDAWAGLADTATGRLVDGDTLFPVFSVSKGITATLIHQLVERGLVSYETRIAEVWPAFGAHGKAEIRVRHALAHTAGLPYMPQGVGLGDLAHWETMCAAIAELTPVSPPGTEFVYHAVTFGWLLGEVARRVDGRPFPQMLAEEICRPLGMTDLYVGIPDAAAPRVALLEDAEEVRTNFVPPDDTLPQSVPGWMQPLSAMMNRPDARRTCLPASNGIMSARALARHYAALLPGGVAGVELLPPARVRQAIGVRATGAVGAPLGYHHLGDAAARAGRLPVFGHGGHGGSLGCADPEYRLAVGFTKNRCTAGGTPGEVLRELRLALGLPVE
jgi:CubicO group peptidase (beta-lactamase class C family)